jgi:hypothetical protein
MLALPPVVYAIPSRRFVFRSFPEEDGNRENPSGVVIFRLQLLCEEVIMFKHLYNVFTHFNETPITTIQHVERKGYNKPQAADDQRNPSGTAFPGANIGIGKDTCGDEEIIEYAYPLCGVVAKPGG